MVGSKGNVGLTARLAGFYVGLDYENLPPQVIDRAKYFCLDHLGVAIRGSTTPSSAAMQDTVLGLAHQGSSVIMGTPLTTSPDYAALANGTSAHSLELDDVNNDSSLHPGVPTFPAAFACGDLQKVSGRDFITAITAGYDLMIRLGRTLDPSKHYARGFHPTGTCGVFGASIVASKLLHLGEEQTIWALGIAGSQAAGSLEFLAQGAWTKRFHAGWSAHSGVLAALLASHGFTGPTTILEGRHGFLRSYSDDVDLSKADEGLGDRFYITKVGIKPHSCCRYSQGPIDCILEIVERHHLQPHDVDGLTVGVLQAGFEVVASPEEQKRNPQNTVDAQFSMPFSAAVAIIYGRASLEEYTEEAVRSPEVAGLMARVKCVVDPALEVDYPSKWPAWVEIKTRDGRNLRADVEYPKGDPENALSWDELKDKFRHITEPVIATTQQDLILETVERLEGLEDIRTLANLTRLEG